MCDLLLCCSLCCRLILSYGEDSVDISNSLIDICAVVNHHVKYNGAVVLNDTEGVGLYSGDVLSAGEHCLALDDLCVIKIEELVLTHDLLVKLCVGEGEVITVGVQLILGEVDDGGVVHVGTVLVVTALLEAEILTLGIVKALDGYRLDELAEVRLVDLVTLLCGLIEVLYLVVDLVVDIIGAGLTAVDDVENHEACDSDDCADSGNDLHVTGLDKESNEHDTDYCKSKSDDGAGMDTVRGKVFQITFCFHKLNLTFLSVADASEGILCMI